MRVSELLCVWTRSERSTAKEDDIGHGESRAAESELLPKLPGEESTDERLKEDHTGRKKHIIEKILETEEMKADFATLKASSKLSAQVDAFLRNLDLVDDDVVDIT